MEKFKCLTFVLMVLAFANDAFAQEARVHACQETSQEIALSNGESLYIDYILGPVLDYLRCECQIKPIEASEFTYKREIVIGSNTDPFAPRCNGELCRFITFITCTETRWRPACSTNNYSGRKDSIQEEFGNESLKASNLSMAITWKSIRNYTNNLTVEVRITVEDLVMLNVRCTRTDTLPATQTTTTSTALPTTTTTSTPLSSTNPATHPIYSSSTAILSTSTTSTTSATQTSTPTNTPTSATVEIQGTNNHQKQNSSGSNDKNQTLIIGVAVAMAVLVAVAVTVVVVVLLKYQRRKNLGARQSPVGNDSTKVRYVSAAEMESHNVHATIDAVQPRTVTDNPTYDMTHSIITQSIPMEVTYATVNKESKKNKHKDLEHGNQVPENHNDDYFEDCTQFRRPEVPPKSRDYDADPYVHSAEAGNETKDQSIVSNNEIEFEDNEIYEAS